MEEKRLDRFIILNEKTFIQSLMSDVATFFMILSLMWICDKYFNNAIVFQIIFISVIFLTAIGRTFSKGNSKTSIEALEYTIKSIDDIVAQPLGKKTGYTENNRYPRFEWKFNVKNDNTNLGYWMWVRTKLKIDEIKSIKKFAESVIDK